MKTSQLSAEGFDTAYFPRLAAIESSHYWFRSRNRLIQWAMGRYFSDAKNFLEIGCGTGFVLSGIEKAFPSLVLHGSELYSEGLSYAKKRLERAKLFQMDARQIPHNNEFDVIGAFDMLEHVEEDTLVLSQMHQALKQNGGVLLTVPQHPSLWSRFDIKSHHKRRYTARELSAKVNAAGFKILCSTSYVSLLLPFLFLSRFGKRDVSISYDVIDDLRVPAGLSEVLEKIMDLERALIQRGISFSAGGSLLMVARKE